MASFVTPPSCQMLYGLQLGSSATPVVPVCSERQIGWPAATRGEPPAAGLGMTSRAFASRAFEKSFRYFSKARLAKALDVVRSEEHTPELQSHSELVCRLRLENKKHT